MLQTGHKSIEMVLRYVRQANAFTDNAGLALGCRSLFQPIARATS
jgi:hypothetical protein